MAKTFNAVSYASLQASNSYTQMPKLKLHSLLLAFLNIILLVLCTLISMTVKHSFQLLLKYCQVIISSEINSKQSVPYLVYRLVITSSKMFPSEQLFTNTAENTFLNSFYFFYNTTLVDQWTCYFVLYAVRFIKLQAVFYRCSQDVHNNPGSV